MLRMSLRRNRLPLGSLFGFGLCGCVLLVSGVAHGRGSMSFVCALCLLVLFFFLRLFLDAGKLSQDFFALFFGLAATGELHGEDLFDESLALGPTHHTETCDIGSHTLQRVPHRAPLVNDET